MRIFSGAGNQIAKPVKSLVRTLANSKSVHNLTTKMARNEDFYSLVALYLIAGKKFISSIFNTRESLKNYHLPDEQRKFLAIQEVINSVLVIGFTLTIGRFMGINLKNSLLKNKKLSQWIKTMTPQMAKEVKKGIGMSLALAGAVISYRVLVPLLALPLTQALKEKLLPSADFKVEPHIPIYSALLNDSEEFNGSLFQNPVDSWVDNFSQIDKLNTLA